ncbi:hypothetical protein REC12_22175 [Desulfosporosinus sp. PR]|uniref:hypothetical protein n=1 Tax=Candidatus Desulfosporosinus nitrosoreducens TaxID=3401928 RepID=UPI0027EF343C|nr:hypothetical protein [Desulfosporosinus sp. PR]MDQ7096305.1 hypothetical protein [Desulfosporosinus sp. PR]
MRQKIGYNVIDRFRNEVRTGNATPQEIWDAMRDIYTKNGMEQYLDPIKQQLREASINKGYSINFGE